MNAIRAGIDFTQLEGFARAMREAPKVLTRELAKAYGQIGRYDIQQFRATGFGRMKSKRVPNTYKFRATDPERAKGISDLFLSEYSRWKAAELFEEGGTVRAKGKSMPILQDRKFGLEKINKLVKDGKAHVVPTPRGPIIVRTVGGMSKKGAWRKNSRTEVLAIFRRQIVQEDRLNFYEQPQRNASTHQAILAAAIEVALQSLVAPEKG